jgi:hypothetical protein
MTTPSLSHPEVCAIIANKLTTGLYHPGDPAKEQLPTTLRLPFFRGVGAPPEMVRQVNETVMMMAEAIVYLIETDGQCDLVPRNQPTSEESP